MRELRDARGGGQKLCLGGALHRAACSMGISVLAILTSKHAESKKPYNHGKVPSGPLNPFRSGGRGLASLRRGLDNVSRSKLEGDREHGNTYPAAGNSDDDTSQNNKGDDHDEHKGHRRGHHNCDWPLAEILLALLQGFCCCRDLVPPGGYRATNRRSDIVSIAQHVDA